MGYRASRELVRWCGSGPPFLFLRLVAGEVLIAIIVSGDDRGYDTSLLTASGDRGAEAGGGLFNHILWSHVRGAI